MTIRYLIAAAFLLGSACGAQADVLRGAGQSGMLTSWNGKGVHAVASNYVAPAAAPVAVAQAPAQAPVSAPVLANVDNNAGGVFDGAPSPSWGPSGNGATVITPVEGGQSGGAIVQLPAPAQGKPPVVSADLPSQPSAAVPEPSSIALMLAGMMGALGIARRRKR